jgi:4'-phosphopantetheinyl transferase EntD
MIDDILPAVAVAAESFGPPGERELFPAEEAVIATADPVRRREFAAGRAVARAALAGLHVPAGPVLPGRAGEPRWPDGVVGSITHCAGYRACAVTMAGELAAIGIDAEPCLALADGLLEEIAGTAEQARLAELNAASPGVPWDRVMFCAKEAVYKAWYQRTGQRPGLRSMTVHVVAPGTFAAAVPPARLTGRWLASSGLIVTAVSVPRWGYPQVSGPLRVAWIGGTS